MTVGVKVFVGVSVGVRVEVAVGMDAMSAAEVAPKPDVV